MNQKKVTLIISLFFIAAGFFLPGCKNGERMPSSDLTLLQTLRAISPEFVRFSKDSEDSFCAEINQSQGIRIHREVAKPIMHEKSMGTTRIWIEKDGRQLYKTEIPGQFHLAGYYSKNFELLVYPLFPDGGFIRASGLAMINLKTGEKRKIGPEGSFQYVSLAPDGKHALLVSDDGIEVVQIPEGGSYQISVEGIAHAADPWINEMAGGSVNLSGDFMGFDWNSAMVGKLIVKNEQGEIVKSIPIKIDKEKIMRKEISRRKRLISAVVEKIKMHGFSDFDASLFPIIKVRESDEDLYVTFGRQIYFFPLNSVYLYAAAVRFDHNIKESQEYDLEDYREAVSSYKVKENPQDMEYDIEKVKCFVMTKDLKEKFDFVIEAINKSDEVGSLDPNNVPADFNMTIWERKDHYEISIDYQYHSFYKIKKETGQIYDGGHQHYVERPVEEKICWEVVDFELFNKNVRLVAPGMQKEQVLELIGKPIEEKGNVWVYKDLEGSRMPEPGEQVFTGAGITFKDNVVEKIDLTWIDATGAGPRN